MVCYNLILNSVNRIANTPINNCSFNIDWALLVEGKYNVTFSFIGSCQNVISSSSLPALHIDLGQNMVNLNLISTGFQQCVSSFQLGSIPFTNNTALSMYRLECPCSFNNALFLKNRPLNNTFNVSIRQSDGTLFLDNSSVMMRDYTIILHFELVV